MWDIRICFFMLLGAVGWAESSPVAISIVTSKSDYYFTEPILCTYTIQNISAGSLLIPKELVEYPRGNPRFLIIEEKTGDHIDSLRLFFPLHHPHPTPFDLCITLKPGEKFCRSIDLWSVYYPAHNVGRPRLDTEGKFKVTFVYENTFLNAQGTTYTTLRGRYHSNAVSFILRAPNEDERAPLLAGLHSSNVSTLRRALDALSMAHDERVLPRLYDLLDTASLQRQEFACDGLSYFGGNPEVLARLLQKASKDSNEMARIYALAALEEMGDSHCVPTLTEICAQEKFGKASLVAARILLMKFEAVEHLDKIEAVMKRHFGEEGDVTWGAKIRELRKKAAK